MMVAGRGNRLLTFYMNPAKFPNPERDWPFLAGLIKWTRHNATTLAQTEMILGDPYRGEAYGYAHFLGRRGILALRNPFIQPQTVHVKLMNPVVGRQAMLETGRMPPRWSSHIMRRCIEVFGMAICSHCTCSLTKQFSSKLKPAENHPSPSPGCGFARWIDRKEGFPGRLLDPQGETLGTGFRIAQAQQD